jgi:hypothetical protein
MFRALNSLDGASCVDGAARRDAAFHDVGAWLKRSRWPTCNSSSYRRLPPPRDYSRRADHRCRHRTCGPNRVLNTEYRISCIVLNYRVALTVTLNTRQGSAAGGTISFWSHVYLALHNTSFDVFELLSASPIDPANYAACQFHRHRHRHRHRHNKNHRHRHRHDYTDTIAPTPTPTQILPHLIANLSPRSPIVTNSHPIRATDIPIDSARTREFELDAHILLTSDPFRTLTSSLEVGSGTRTDGTRSGVALRPKLTLD